MKIESGRDIRLALVGLGHVASHQIAAVERTDGIRLVAGCDNHPDMARRLGDGVSFYPSINELLSAGHFDIVMISTPNREHFHHGELVIDAGKDLILEKPAVEKKQQLDQLVRKAERSGTFLYFSLHAAFGPEVIWIQRQIADGDLSLGKLRRFCCFFYDPYIVDQNLKRGAKSLGGSWMDSGMNALSVIGNFVESSELQLADSQMRASAELDCSEIEGLVSVESEGARGFIHTSWLTGRNQKSTLLGFDDDEVLLDHSRQKVSTGRGKCRESLFAYQGPQHRLTNHYIGVFSDLVVRYSSGRSNADFAVPLQRLFFEAEENRRVVEEPLSMPALYDASI